MENPLISVIVPVYNTEAYLCRAIESLLVQTHVNLEIILINDGSTDGSGVICDKYANEDNRILVFHQENAGVSGARNVGINNASGQWIGFVDPDDWVEPDIFESLLDTALENQTSIAVCGFTKHFDGGWTEIRLCNDAPGFIPAKDAFRYVLGGKHFEGFLWNKLFDASLIRNTGLQFNSKFHTCQDLVFVVETLAQGSDLAYVNKPLYHYCLRKGSKTQAFNQKRLTELAARERVIECTVPISKKWSQIAKSHYSAAAVSLMRDAVAYNAPEHLPALKKESRRYFRQLLFCRELDFRLKVRAVVIYLIPKTSYRVWAIIKNKFNITWWKKEIKKVDLP